ncbi:enoyl-CoA hydratase/isomerase family protein [Rhodococcus sp. SJ-3]|uniref:enoyl-CoA hydratase/isomerase family protein n=1 Tax=Rhodococcus sp. SJ-3 TaxID=3454628 RepID=UPI003F7A7E1F
MSNSEPPSAEEIILYEKDPASKIATITFNRPDRLNAPTVEARLRYADLLHRASIDDDVKVLVVRAEGDDFGSGVDLPDFMAGIEDGDSAERLKEFRIDDPDVVYPPKDSYRNMGNYGPWFADAQSGCRSLQEFNKISIVEVKGYCYGWHFYQAADADLVIASDDALFGHAAFRYVGWGPRMWTWAMTMGIRRFQEMVFTGRPFTADEMYECGFLNKVVAREDLEDEVQTYAKACARNRPTDTVVIQKMFFRMMKQHQGEYMGSLLTGMVESMGRLVRPDEHEFHLDAEMMEAGLTNSVKANDENFPPEFRLSKAARLRP